MSHNTTFRRDAGRLVAWADGNCATPEVREALRVVPDRAYVSLADLAAFFEAVEQREAEAVATFPTSRS
jgi:hypothetical protein